MSIVYFFCFSLLVLFGRVALCPVFVLCCFFFFLLVTSRSVDVLFIASDSHGPVLPLPALCAFVLFYFSLSACSNCCSWYCLCALCVFVSYNILLCRLSFFSCYLFLVFLCFFSFNSLYILQFLSSDVSHSPYF